MDEKFLILPKIVKEYTRAKIISNVPKPDISMLTLEQKDIFDTITNLPLNIFSRSLITGYAGSGKTFLVTKIIEQFLYTNSRIKIAITAPTNKAVRVLKNLSSISEHHRKVKFATLHSLLGMKREITFEGKEVFKSNYYGGTIDKFSIVLVDEVSMLDNELYDELLLMSKCHGIVLLFIGDKAQIPPVNGGESRIFNEILDNNFNLTKIIRQANDNPIIKLANMVRQNENLINEIIVDKNDNGVIFLPINTEMELLDKYFNSKNFTTNPNFVKVLAWTNRAVDYYNSKIRELIYGKEIGMLNIGEKMICNRPITDGQVVILNNNDEFEVISYEIKIETEGIPFIYYLVKVSCEDKKYVIKILAEESKTVFKEELEKLKTIAINKKSNSLYNPWLGYYFLIDKYADVKYNYALTVHKSQGSTFDNVIVINCDIKRIRDENERSKLLYTAMTRAKNKLFMI